MSPDVRLDCESWRHMEHNDGHCSCRSSDRTAAYVHELALMPQEFVMPSSEGGGGGAAAHSTISNERSCVEPCIGIGHPGSVPFVSDRPGAYGRLLLTVYMRWRTGMLVPSDWLSPVTWGGWRAVK